MKFKLLVARRPGSSQLCLPYGLPSWVCFLWGLLGQLSVSVAAFWWLFPGLPVAGGHSGTYPSLLLVCVSVCVWAWAVVGGAFAVWFAGFVVGANVSWLQPASSST